MGTSELWLIAHKVRGEAAFDVATRMECPECGGTDVNGPYCDECEDSGYWWIVPTSGHRAYPYAHGRLHLDNDIWLELDWIGEMPEGLPDHYAVRSAPAPRKPAFLQRLIAKAPIDRRGM